MIFLYHISPGVRADQSLALVLRNAGLLGGGLQLQGEVALGGIHVVATADCSALFTDLRRHGLLLTYL